MISIEPDGRVTFSVRVPAAKSVELVGSLRGWNEERVAMTRTDDGMWSVELPVASGEHLFRYRVDDERWLLDHEAHGVSVNDDGERRSRLWCPPTHIEPDSIAA